MGEFGWEKILIIAVVVLVLFGSKKIPEMMRGLGTGVREFNNAKKGLNTNADGASSAAKNQTSDNITDVEHEPVK